MSSGSAPPAEQAAPRGRGREIVVAVAVAVAVIALQRLRYAEELSRWDEWSLPAFDGYAYLAMAEHPGVFTLAPWGYRILVPALVHALGRVLPGVGPLPIFDGVCLASMTSATALCFLFLRRLGHRRLPAWLAIAALGLSRPVAEVVSYPMLADAVAFLLVTAFLLALQEGASVITLGLLAVAGVLAKEYMLALLPLVWLVRREALGDLGALRQAAAVAAPTVLAWAIPRLWWRAPVRLPPGGALSERFPVMVEVVRGDPSAALAIVLVGGIVPLAALGALRPAGRRFLRRWGLGLAAALVLPLLTPYVSPHHLLGDLPRYLLYALPLLLPLALGAAGRVLPGFEPQPSPGARVRTAGGLALTLPWLAALLPLAGLDSYRRVDLGLGHDGPLVLGLTRETLRTAARLDRGKPVIFDVDAQRFTPDHMEAERLGQMRWFLREGWGDHPQYGLQVAAMRAPRATLILPCLRPRRVRLAFALGAEHAVRVGVTVNGQAVGELTAEPERGRQSVEVPASTLFRGDNEVALSVAGNERPQLHTYALWPQGEAP